MYLKSLEIFGFKSFAPKTVLEFHRGVTCVVGPNGCGKSNVLDAILWVLGEQSAKALRGTEMTDVIFSGTDSRPPLGMAEVSMTFSECEEQLGLDWHEVTVTRKVFREGGSEYFLNKTPCRLRDIHQLFMDTGIGRSAYSVMQQGKIDAILSTKPEDRRSIFEEAAGITKYKSQKKEALRKLDATDANLIRLADIIKEVKRQIGSLQRQAGKARRYQSIIADLRLLELHHAREQWETLAARREDTRSQLAQTAAQLTEREEAIEAHEAEASMRRATLEEMEARLTQARQAVNDIRTRISNHENRLGFNEERAREFTDLATRYRSDVAAAEEKFRTQEAQLHSTDAELAQITEMLATELRRMEEKQAAAAAIHEEKSGIESAVHGFGEDSARIENRIHQLRGHISGVNQTREGAEARLALLADESNQLEFAFAQLTEQRGHAEFELSRTSLQLEGGMAEVAAAETALRDAQQQLATIERELREAQRMHAEKDSRVEVLRQLVESGEGLGEGAQAVLRGLDQPDFFKPAVAGALAQLIEVAPAHVRAVEAALNGHLQAIVMKDATVAEVLIQTLTQQRLGRATLALREMLPAAKETPCVPQLLPAVALRPLVQSSADLAPLLDDLLADTYLVETLSEALLLRREHRANFVTLTGELMTVEGLLIGGTAAEAGNSMLERKNQLAALEAEAVAAQAQVWEVSTRRETLLNEIDGIQARLEEARVAKAAAAEQVAALRGQLAMLDRETRETERKQQNLEGEQASIEARRADAAARVAQLESEVASALSQLESLQARRVEAQDQLEELRAREADIAGDLNELRVQVATERQRHSSLHHQRAPMEARLTELQELIAQRQADIDAYEQRAAATRAESEEIAANLETLRARVSEGELEVARLLDERAELAAQVEELNQTLRVFRHQITELHEQRSRFEVRSSQLEMKATALHEHITKRYQLDIAGFERDLHGLRVAVRDAVKRRNRWGSAETPEGDPAVEGSSLEVSNDAGTTAMTESSEPKTDLAENDSFAQDNGFAVDWAVVESLVRELEQKVDSMGPVNLDAIQEFDELEQRYNFLEQQNTDLTNARTELLETITRINRTTRELFADTFEKIRTNFQEMFTELFGGGKANLVLTDESDPLESGIEIVAKPPGKQLASISLLSGGERTMTAVALLFSIYMVKPSPFCVLDEMDAPLDESNITRFIKILDRFVGQSQFVVISHNKRTIARADAIYGVTMEEHGVSKLVGVKFSTREKHGDSIDVLSSSAPVSVPSVAEAFGKSGNLASEDALATGVA